MSKYKVDTRMIAILGFLVALEIILSRFCSINAWNLKIGFNFVPIAIAAILFGPAAAGTVAALGDFAGALLFPIGAYFPGFTLTALFTGFLFGFFLHKRQTAARILAAVLIHQLVLGLLVNTFWISVLYGSPYFPLLGTRVLQCLVLAPVEFLVIGALAQMRERIGKRGLA